MLVEFDPADDTNILRLPSWQDLHKHGSSSLVSWPTENTAIVTKILFFHFPIRASSSDRDRNGLQRCEVSLARGPSEGQPPLYHSVAAIALMKGARARHLGYVRASRSHSFTLSHSSVSSFAYNFCHSIPRATLPHDDFSAFNACVCCLAGCRPWWSLVKNRSACGPKSNLFS